MNPAASSSSNTSDSEHAKYRGVRKRKWGKWVSEIRLPNSRERIWLGSYDSPEKAARAFDAALFCLRGNTANFNFPHQPPNIPGGTDLHPSQIQAVAAHFANSTSSDNNIPSQQEPNHIASSSSMDHVPPTPTAFLINSSIPDYGIFPGFDDYFFMPCMEPPALTTIDYAEEQVVYDGVYSQDPSFLWNF